MCKSQLEIIHTEHKQIHMVLKFHGVSNWETDIAKRLLRGMIIFKRLRNTIIQSSIQYIPCFCHCTIYPRDLSISIHMDVLYLLQGYNIPLCRCTIICLPSPLLMNTWIGSDLWLLQYQVAQLSETSSHTLESRRFYPQLGHVPEVTD